MSVLFFLLTLITLLSSGFVLAAIAARAYSDGPGEMRRRWGLPELSVRTRWVNRVYAFLCRYFWVPCPRCGREFGGHEVGSGSVQDPLDRTVLYVTCWRCPD